MSGIFEIVVFSRFEAPNVCFLKESCSFRYAKNDHGNASILHFGPFTKIVTRAFSKINIEEFCLKNEVFNNNKGPELVS